MVLAQVILTVLYLLSPKNTLLSVGIPINDQQQQEDTDDVCDTKECLDAAQYLLDSMDTSVEPCQDFYRYACGGWMDKHHTIPDDKTEISNFEMARDKVAHRVAEALTIATNEIHPKPVIDAATIFQGCMDEEAREAQGLDPLRNLLNSVGGWPITNPGWSDVGYEWQVKVANGIRTAGSEAILEFSVTPDAMDSSQNMIVLGQGKVVLGRNEIINMNTDEANTEVLEAYKTYITSAAKLLNPNADEEKLNSDAEEMMQFEAALARLTRPEEERKEPSATYHKMKVSDVDKITENTFFKWTDFLNIVLQDFPEVTDETQIIISDIDYTKNALQLIHRTDSRIVANYFGWALVKEYGPHTTKGFRDIDFDYSSSVTGVVKPEKLESTCTTLTGKIMGFAVGRLYVDKYFSEEEKRDVEYIIEDIRATYEHTLNHNTWMDPDTKTKALEKLRAMTTMMGYPEWIKNDQKLSNYYSSVPNLKQDEFFSSMLKAMEGLAKIHLEKWNKPTKRTTDWVTEPSDVNAFYNPTANSITFPAAVLILPFYKHGRPQALNYGAMGSVIGHEISHGFDDQGSQYDKEGNLVNWWTRETKNDFDTKSNCFRRQYSSQVEPSTNMNLNGNITVGDDIADNGGLRNSFLAYKARCLESQDLGGLKDERLPGISATPEQLFFLGYATLWCAHTRTELVPWYIENGDHTIEMFRIVVPVSNSRAFSEAYSCPPGSPMNPESKCVLW